MQTPSIHKISFLNIANHYGIVKHDYLSIYFELVVMMFGTFNKWNHTEYTLLLRRPPRLVSLVHLFGVSLSHV